MVLEIFYFFIPNINEIYIVNILKIELIDIDDDSTNIEDVIFLI